MGWWSPNAQIADVIQYVIPVAAGTVNCNPTTTLLLLNNASLLATFNVVLPATPTDGQRLTIASAGIITLLNTTGGTVKGLITTLAANGWARFAYSSDAAAWFRTG